MSRLTLLATGGYTPNEIRTNGYFEETLDTSDQWITSRTGIRQRYFETEKTNTQMAIAVAENLLGTYPQCRDNLVAILVSTFTPDALTPSTANLIQAALDLPQNLFTLDFNAACSGFAYGLQLAKGLLLQHPGKQIMLIGSEQISPLLDMEDRNTCILFGDGAAGVILGLDPQGEDYFSFGTQGNNQTIHCGRGAKDRIQMEGKAVFTFAVTVAQQTILDLLTQANLTLSDLKYVVCHQANARIIRHVVRQLKADPALFFCNLDQHGNTSSASIPIALHQLNRQGDLSPGDRILCVGFGAGLTWGGCILTI